MEKCDTDKLPNKDRVWLEIIKIGRETFRKSLRGSFSISVTFNLKKGPMTHHYNPFNLPDDDKIEWIRAPANLKIKCPKYSIEHPRIEIPTIDGNEIPTQPFPTLGQAPSTIRRGPLTIAKSQRGTSLNTYYIENRLQKRKGDISIQIGNEMVTLSPVKAISGRFPELYKHLSVATQKGNWSPAPNQKTIEILKAPIKREITEFVIKNLDTPSPQRRLGPRKNYPSRQELFR